MNPGSQSGSSILSATRSFTVASGTNARACSVFSTCSPNSSRLPPLSRSMSPVEMCGNPSTFFNSLACVPLPEPGAPKRIRHSRLISTGSSGGGLNPAPPAADPSRPRSKALIVTHDQLCFDLIHSVHRDTDHDQQAGSAKVKIHAQTVQQPARESRVDPVAEPREPLQFDAGNHDLRQQRQDREI